MSSAPAVLDHLPTIDVARDRAGELVASGAQAVRQAAGEVSDRVHEVDVDVLVGPARSHRLRTAIIALVVVALIGLLIKKATSSPPPDEPR